MSSSKATILFGLAGVGLAIYYGRKQSATLAALAKGSAQQPVLPSTVIGSGDLGPIWGGTGLRGILPSQQIGDGYINPIVPPIGIDSSGDVSAPYGTDIISHDPLDLPDVSSVYGDELAALRNESDGSTDGGHVDNSAYDEFGNFIG